MRLQSMLIRIGVQLMIHYILYYCSTCLYNISIHDQCIYTVPLFDIKMNIVPFKILIAAIPTKFYF